MSLEFDLGKETRLERASDEYVARTLRLKAIQKKIRIEISANGRAEFFGRSNEELGLPGEWRQVRALAKHLGVPLEFSKRLFLWPQGIASEISGEYAWNGRRLLVWGQPPENVIHDIAHWLVAPAEWRKEPEFGLGTSPSWFARSAFSNKGRSCAKEITHEEELASVLGILIQARLGMPFVTTMEEHNWEEISLFRERVIELRDRKLVHGLVPRCVAGVGQVNHRLIRIMRTEDQ